MNTPIPSRFPNFPIFELSPSQALFLRSNDLHPCSSPVWVQGRPEALSLTESLPDRGLAIVGSRQIQSRTERHIRSTLYELRGQNLVIISGLATGVDQIAHESALESGLPTIAVLAHGLQEIYPPQNEPLASRILEAGGLLFTQYPLGQKGHSELFLERNRWIAALSKAVWVSQAAWRSGALNTARHARELGKMIFATPGYPGDPALSGNERLFNQNEALPLRDALDLTSCWIELASSLAQIRSRKKKPGTLVRIRELTFDHGLPLLSAIRRVADEQGRPYEAVLLDFEREMKQTPST